MCLIPLAAALSSLPRFLIQFWKDCSLPQVHRTFSRIAVLPMLTLNAELQGRAIDFRQRLGGLLGLNGVQRLAHWFWAPPGLAATPVLRISMSGVIQVVALASAHTSGAARQCIRLCLCIPGMPLFRAGGLLPRAFACSECRALLHCCV